MTAIAGLVHNNKIYIGSDSAGVEGLNLSIMKEPKVFIKWSLVPTNHEKYIFGYTSSFRMGQLLQYVFQPPKNEFTNGLKSDVMYYMVTKFIPALRECFKLNGFQTTENNVDIGGNFLVGYRNQLFEIESDYHVSQSVKPFNACGCGKHLILGSLYTSENLNISPEDRIQKALEAAQEYSAGVRAPFKILHI